MIGTALGTVWHDLEYGGYAEDLPLWRELAERHGAPVLEIGAGTGRVALDLARRGHQITALDADAALLEVLSERGAGLDVRTVTADARRFELEDRYRLCLVPMQTLQLLGGAEGRIAFLTCARRHLLTGGLLAAAIVTELEAFEVSPGAPAPLPDVVERDGVLLWSQPTAVRVRPNHFVLERRREVVGRDGERSVTDEAIWLDRVSTEQLEAEGAAAGLHRHSRRLVPATVDYAASEVVILGA